LGAAALQHVVMQGLALLRLAPQGPSPQAVSRKINLPSGASCAPSFHSEQPHRTVPECQYHSSYKKIKESLKESSFVAQWHNQHHLLMTPTTLIEPGFNSQSQLKYARSSIPLRAAGRQDMVPFSAEHASEEAWGPDE
jgi:hypothetical protein